MLQYDIVSGMECHILSAGVGSERRRPNHPGQSTILASIVIASTFDGTLFDDQTEHYSFGNFQARVDVCSPYQKM